MAETTLELPHNDEVERHLLGACLQYRPALVDAARWCRGRDFHRLPHRQLWAAMEWQQEHLGAPDYVSLPDALRATGVTDEAIIAALVRDVGDWRIDVWDVTRGPEWARIIEGHAVRRRMIQAGGRI